MYYVQLPANWFYFVLGMIVGVIVFIIILSTWAKKEEKKNKEKLANLFNQLVTTNDETEAKVRKTRTKKNDK